MKHLLHLAQRFLGSLDPRGPSPAEERWAESHLVPGEVELWRRMSGPDRRHAAGVARRTVAALHQPDRAVVAAALLHDVGKVESGLGTLARSFVTAIALVTGRARLVCRRPGGRAGRYLRHDALGASLLREAGSDPLTIAWSREHHLPSSRWTVPAEVGQALKAADDD